LRGRSARTRPRSITARRRVRSEHRLEVAVREEELERDGPPLALEQRGQGRRARRIREQRAPIVGAEHEVVEHRAKAAKERLEVAATAQRVGIVAVHTEETRALGRGRAVLGERAPLAARVLELRRVEIEQHELDVGPRGGDGQRRATTRGDEQRGGARSSGRQERELGARILAHDRELEWGARRHGRDGRARG
jgi:hypothetical protein